MVYSGSQGSVHDAEDVADAAVLSDETVGAGARVPVNKTDR